MQNRKTIAKAFYAGGVEFHTGKRSVIRVCPAEQENGIQFHCGKHIAEAVLANLAFTHKSTTSIQVGPHVISTVEHLLAALFGLGITDVIIEVEQGTEVPILDGSAKPWVDKILASGVKQTIGYKREIVLPNVIKFKNGVSEYVLTPSNKFSIEVEVDFPKTVIGRQYATYDDHSSFMDNIAWARTFIGDAAHGEKLDKEKIRARLKSVDIDRPEESPCILYEGDRYITPLRHDNEPATHKLLDLIGDLSLLGGVLKAHVVAKKPSHAANHLLAKELQKVTSNGSTPTP